MYFNLCKLSMYFCSISSFHLLIHPLLGLDHHIVALPLRVAGLLFQDVIGCHTYLFRLKVNVITFSLREKDIYGLTLLDGTMKLDISGIEVVHYANVIFYWYEKLSTSESNASPFRIQFTKCLLSL